MRTAAKDPPSEVPVDFIPSMTAIYLVILDEQVQHARSSLITGLISYRWGNRCYVWQVPRCRAKEDPVRQVDRYRRADAVQSIDIAPRYAGIPAISRLSSLVGTRPITLPFAVGQREKACKAGRQVSTG